MTGFIKQIGDFTKRGGFYVFLSTLISQMIQFVISIVIVRILTQSEYGEFVFMQSIVMFIIPFSGLGLNFALLRYGALSKSKEERQNIYNACLFYGVIASSILWLVFSILVFLLPNNLVESKVNLIILLLLLVTNYFKEIVQSYLRIEEKNKEFAISNIVYTIGLFILTIVLTFGFETEGLILSRVIMPLLVFILVFKSEKLRKIKNKKNIINLKEYASYGILIGLGSVASQSLYQLDTILMGVLKLDKNLIAIYKNATIIPFTILFIPSVIMTTDFVLISKNYNNKKFLVEYRNKMLKFLFLLSTVGTIVSFFVSEKLIVLLYGKQYADSASIMNILMIGIIAAFSLRTPNGNILAAVGMSKWNAILSYGSVAINIIMNYFFIRIYGVYGAAIATSLVMWITGIISAILCNKYINRL